MNEWRILQGDALEVLRTLEDESVHCCVTSPPYWGLRDYGIDSQLGLERTPEEYVEKLVEVFREARRVLRADGTVWLNLGDCYATGAGKVGDCPGGGEQGERWKGNRGTHHSANSGKHGPSLAAMGPRTQPNRMPLPGLKPKDLIGIPWRVAFALQADGWYLRSDIIWSKPNPMPESVTDRPTKAHEYIFLLAKSERYWYDADAIREEHKAESIARYEYGLKTTAANALPGSQRDRFQAGVGDSERMGDFINYDGRNKRSVWTVATQPFPEAHFATFPPKLIEPCILAGCPGPRKMCDCDELILTPVGSGEIEDPSLHTGRAGYNRTRRENEGTRPITRREQREYAKQIKASRHRTEMERICGPAFAHYIRTDRSGARPLPPKVLDVWLKCGWLKEPGGACSCPVSSGGTVLDPFAGAGTTGLVALRFNRKFIGIELNPEYVEMATRRIEQDAPLFNTVTEQ